MQILKMSKLIYRILVFVLVVGGGTGCGKKNQMSGRIDSLPPIYPDYIDIAVPVNIAPLNFKSTDSVQKIIVDVKGKQGQLQVTGTRKAIFPLKKFKKLLGQHAGDTLWVEVKTLKAGQWTSFRSFYWEVKPEPIDPFLTYRLIEPGYEVWNKITINQRELSSFNEKVLADNNLIGGACVNCHISNKQSPGTSFFHLRHQQGGTIISQGGKLRKIDTRTDSTLSAGVYGNWHPSGRFIAFSGNIIIPEFYAVHNKRMEVYDTSSDLFLLDIQKNEVISSPLLARADQLETFPEFSADGKTLFFCVADSVRLPDHYQLLKYRLCSISFDASQQTFGEKIDTLFDAAALNRSVSEPKASPDGRFLLVTAFNYGTFPIWHTEAKLFMLNLATKAVDTLTNINTNHYSNSYHSWSANSRWFVFASKREDGLYGKPYFAYVDENGTVAKPFVLPQKDPGFYDNFLKSFNIPELFERGNTFDFSDIEKIFEQPAEKVRFRTENEQESLNR